MHAAPQLQNIPWWGKNYFKGRNARMGGAKYTKYNKINNNSESFGRWGGLLLGGSFTLIQL